MKKKKYINNKELYEHMKIHKKRMEESNSKDVRASEYIGKAILLICNNLAKKPNFSGYTYKLEMISDGIIDCVAAIDNFNPEKTNNPFAYFTQIAWNAFIRRIHKEKKQTYIKHKNYENLMMTDSSEFSHNKILKNEYSEELVRNYETALTKSKKQAKLVGIEKFSPTDEVKIHEETDE